MIPQNIEHKQKLTNNFPHPVRDASLGKKTKHTVLSHPVRDASLGKNATTTLHPVRDAAKHQ